MTVKIKNPNNHQSVHPSTKDKRNLQQRSLPSAVARLAIKTRLRPTRKVGQKMAPASANQKPEKIQKPVDPIILTLSIPLKCPSFRVSPDITLCISACDKLTMYLQDRNAK